MLTSAVDKSVELAVQPSVSDSVVKSAVQFSVVDISVVLWQGVVPFVAFVAHSSE